MICRTRAIKPWAKARTTVVAGLYLVGLCGLKPAIAAEPPLPLSVSADHNSLATRGLIEKARTAIQIGDYDRADRLLGEAEADDLAAIRMAENLMHQAQETADRRRLSAATTRAERGELSLTRLDYLDAAEHFRTAADLLPASAVDARGDYLNRYTSVFK